MIGGNVDQVRTEAHRVVVRHCASIFEAEHIVSAQGGSPRQPTTNRIGGRVAEAPVVADQLMAEHPLGVASGGGAGEAQFAGEPVLQGAPKRRSMLPWQR